MYLQSTENVCTHLVRCLEKLPQKEEVFIMGDFNCNILSKYALSSKIKDLCSSLSLKQLIMEPTRVTINSSTLIDLIMDQQFSCFKIWCHTSRHQ